ncbi:MAG: restriction endonuclease subunit S, partial [Tissierella sp.]|uniref:restriction endonuclease subunit S n=1 Tax=Tissierella sp. TaxID=41274 RepID=UPI003F95AD22
MSKWREVRLGEYIDTLKGNAFKSSLYKNNGIPVVRVSNFTDESIEKDKMVYIDYDEDYDRFILEKKDVLCQTVGSWLNNPNSLVGKIVRVPDYLDGSYLNQNIVKIIPDENLDNDYLFYRLKAVDYKHYCVDNAQGAANQASITLKTIRRFKFSLPDLKTQEKIADLLSAYDELIENNNKRIEILEKTAEEIYKEWFVRMRFPGHENTKFIKGIPEGWEVKNFINKEVKLLSSGINEFKGYKRYLATADVEGINLKHGENITFIDKPSRANMEPKENTIWFAKMQDSVKHLYFKNHSKGLINNIILSTGFAGIEFKNINYYYYYLSFIRYGIFESIKDMYANGSTQVAINNQNIKRIKLLIPDENLMTKFNNIVEQNFEIIEKYKVENQNLIKQRDLLLPRLINGTIQV